MKLKKTLVTLMGAVAFFAITPYPLIGIANASSTSSIAEKKAQSKKHALNKRSVQKSKKALKAPIKTRAKKAAGSKRQGKVKPASIKRKQGSVRNLPMVTADGKPLLRSSVAVVYDQVSGKMLYQKNADAVVPIASITKLMTAMVVLDARQNLKETLSVDYADVDRIKGSSSKLPVNSKATREEMLLMALMSSENRAASALARYYPGGESAFVSAMNIKAKMLGLKNTRFYDSTGLNPKNVSSANDLAKMVSAASDYKLIRNFSTDTEYVARVKGHTTKFRNTNRLVGNEDWDIGVSKTGYISEAGKCLVMAASVNNRPTIIVLLDAPNSSNRIMDAQRVKKWVETQSKGDLDPTST